MARVLLDTGVLVGAVRRKVDLSVIAAEDDVAIPAIVVAEFLAGIELDGHEPRRTARRRLLDQILEVTVLEDYTVRVAQHHAELLAHTRRSGRPRGAHDLIVAATARATERVLLTIDNKVDFAELPGVRARYVALAPNGT